jgi:predicted membrane protein
MPDWDRDEWRQAMRDRRDEWRQARREHWRGRHSGVGGLLVGTIFAGIGVLLLLQNLGILYVDDLWQYWPVILIVLGVSRAATSYAMGGRIGGGVMIAVGTIFLLHNLDIIHGNVWNFFWPVILICVGLGMLARNLDGHPEWNWPGGIGPGGIGAGISGGSSTATTLHEVAIFGGGPRRIESQELEGGEVTVIFGGIGLDLRPAGTKKDKIVIEANAVFGGIDIRVPENWTVTVRGAGIFGGYVDRTAHVGSGEGAKQPHLIIRGAAVFGGVTVKN